MADNAVELLRSPEPFLCQLAARDVAVDLDDGGGLAVESRCNTCRLKTLIDVASRRSPISPSAAVAGGQRSGERLGMYSLQIVRPARSPLSREPVHLRTPLFQAISRRGCERGACSRRFGILA
jgi:hypothetical protein